MKRQRGRSSGNTGGGCPTPSRCGQQGCGLGASFARTVLAFVVALIWLHVPGMSLADSATAKRHFQRAQTAYRLGKYEQAVKAYEAAYEALSSPAFLFNIAQAQRMQYSLDKKIWRLHKALALYKSYLREADQASNRQVVERIIDELKQLLTDVERRSQDQDEPGQLVLRGTDGARAKIDGKDVGVLPVRMALEPGTHVIRVDKQGYMPWESTVRLSAGGQLDVPVALRALHAAQPRRRPRAKQEDPFYRKWWFWTVAGAVVAAGAGTGIYFAARGDEGDGIPTIDLRR